MRNPTRMVILVIAVLLTLMTATATVSADTRAGEKVIVSADEVVPDDLYVTGQDIVIDGTVQGDVLGFARSVTVNGTVTGDLLVGAQAVIVNGIVEDDARIGCQVFTLNPGGEVGDDLAIGAYSFAIQPDSVVGGNLWYGSFLGAIAGQVDGDVSGGSSGLSIQGTVGGNVNVEVGEDASADGFSSMFSQFMPPLPSGAVIPDVPGGLTVSPDASITGKLNYSAPDEGDVSPEASTGEVTFNLQAPQGEEQVSPTEAFLNGLLRQVRRLIRLLVVGFLMVWLIPGWLDRARRTLSDRPWPSLGWGALSPVALGAFLVITVIIVLILSLVLRFVVGETTIVTVLLTSLAGSVTLAYLLLAFYIAALIVGYALGRMVLERVQPGQAPSPFLAMALGVVIVWGVTLVPILGPIAGLVLGLFGVGAVWLAVRAHLTNSAAEPMLAD
jgi:carbonic anhydrase/acetyltransferase-like protein (isoleucine patch superfamily)